MIITILKFITRFHIEYFSLLNETTHLKAMGVINCNAFQSCKVRCTLKNSTAMHFKILKAMFFSEFILDAILYHQLLAIVYHQLFALVYHQLLHLCTISCLHLCTISCLQLCTISSMVFVTINCPVSM